MRKLWQDEAWEEYLYWQRQDKKTLKKINRLLTDIDRNGYQYTGKPEPLSGNLAGYWSIMAQLSRQKSEIFIMN